MVAVQSIAYGEAVENQRSKDFGIQKSTIPGKENEAFETFGSTQHTFVEKQLQDAVEQANNLSMVFDRTLKFEYCQDADIYQVSVIDTSKDEVVRKIPPDEVVRFIESIKDLFGAMLDVQA